MFPFFSVYIKITLFESFNMQLLQLFDLPSLLFSSSALVGGGIAGYRNKTKTFLIAKNLAIPIGIIGTLIGFINMLSSLDDPSALGPAIGVALLPTLYGILMFVLCHITLGYFSPINTMNSITSKNASKHFFSLSNIAAISLLLIVFFAGIEVHGSFLSFIDFTSLLFVGLLVCVPTYFEKPDNNQISLRYQRYQSLYKYSVITMVVAMLCSTISICSNVQDPTAIGPALAVGLLTPLYCSVIIVLTKILHITCPNFQPSKQDSNTQTIILTSMCGIFIFVLLCSGILFASIS